MFAPNVPSSATTSKGLYLKAAIALVVVSMIPLGVFAAKEGWLYGGFPSASKMDRFLQQYPTLTPQRKVDDLKLLLWRMRAPDSDEEDKIAIAGLGKLSEYYLRTHDPAILQAVAEDGSVGIFPDYICVYFYLPLRDDAVFRKTIVNDSKTLKRVEGCDGVHPIYPSEDLRKLFHGKTTI